MACSVAARAVASLLSAGDLQDSIAGPTFTNSSRITSPVAFVIFRTMFCQDSFLRSFKTFEGFGQLLCIAVLGCRNVLGMVVQNGIDGVEHCRTGPEDIEALLKSPRRMCQACPWQKEASRPHFECATRPFRLESHSSYSSYSTQLRAPVPAGPAGPAGPAVPAVPAVPAMVPVTGPGELWSELQDARLRVERQEAAMAGERAETDAVIDDLREQLHLRMLELQDVSALKEHTSFENLELQEMVSHLHLQLAEKAEEVRDLQSRVGSSSVLSNPREASTRRIAVDTSQGTALGRCEDREDREERMRALEALLDLQEHRMCRRTSDRHERGGQIVRAVFATWCMRTAASSAAIAERARLRAHGLERIGRAVASRRQALSRATVFFLRAFKAWASVSSVSIREPFNKAREAEGVLRLGRFFRTWQQLVTTLSSLRKLRWMEPSAVCAPEFAAGWQGSASRVYRAVLLPSPQHVNAPESLGMRSSPSGRK